MAGQYMSFHRLVWMGFVGFVIVGADSPHHAVRIGATAAVAYIRVNQVGFSLDQTKHAVVISAEPLASRAFTVVNTASSDVAFQGAMTDAPAWSKQFPDAYRIDFTALNTAGQYMIRVGDVNSPTFRIASPGTLYRSALDNSFAFYQAQHDGSQVDHSILNRQPTHLMDTSASVYFRPAYRNDSLRKPLKATGVKIDAEGGWFDAGDYLKFVETASYTEALMLFAVREHPALHDGRPSAVTDYQSESRYGLDWLNKMWNPGLRRTYYQVGIGDGNGRSILGDHDFWRLPQADDQRNVAPKSPAYFVKYRPVFFDGGPKEMVSPNLAGRLAADWALCYQVFHQSDPVFADSCLNNAERVYERARTVHIGTLTTASPYDYYPEQEWRDDMELGAAELALALQARLRSPPAVASNLPHTNPSYYLARAKHWAKAYIHGPYDGQDSLNLYDDSGLAHYELVNALRQAPSAHHAVSLQRDVLADMKHQLVQAQQVARHDPFGLGLAYNSQEDLTPHALGLALEAQLFDQVTGSHAFGAFAESQVNWTLGQNAWGSAFIVGLGSTFPHCLQHQVANLSGSLTGGTPVLLGAVVDGPNYYTDFSGLGVQSGMRRCPLSGGNAFRKFDARSARYVDNVAAWPSTEPSDDYTAPTIPLFAMLFGQS